MCMRAVCTYVGMCVCVCLCMCEGTHGRMCACNIVCVGVFVCLSLHTGVLHVSDGL